MDSTSSDEKDLETNEDIQVENDEEREKIYDKIVNSFPIRQNLVDTAANFLRAPHVMNSKIDDKKKFLSKKGLSNHEIQAAFNAAGLSYENAPGLPLGAEPFSAHPYQVIPSPQYQPLMHHHPGVAPVLPTFWTRVRDMCNLAFFLFGTVNAVRYIYRHYIRPWLTGQPPMVPVDMQLLQLQSAVADSLIQLRAAVEAMQKTVAAYTSAMQNSSDSKTLTDVKAELTSLKSLLLSKRSFAPTPTPFALGIPSWQKSCITNDVTKDVSSEAANGGSDLETNGVATDFANNVSIGTTACLDTGRRVSNSLSSNNSKTPDFACDDRSSVNVNTAEVPSSAETNVVESGCGPAAEAAAAGGDPEGSVSPAPCTATAASDCTSIGAAAADYISGNYLPATAQHSVNDVSCVEIGSVTSVATSAGHKDALIAEAIAGDVSCSTEEESVGMEGVFENSNTLLLCNGAVKCSEHEDVVTC